MKPIYLEFSGINSFSEKAEIDFRALLSGGVFGVFGDTGSGKSTILDCIHLALYGRIERSSGNEFLNYAVDQAYVNFEFEVSVEGVTNGYLVHRERRRKSNTAKASLSQRTADGKWLVLAEGTRDVDTAIEEILGLNFADFKMCIALPQGDFAALVNAAPNERSRLVSRLFDLERYGDRLTKAVNDKYFQAEQACAIVRAKMGENEGVSIEELQQKQEALKAGQAELEDLKKNFEAVDTALAALLKTQEELRAYEDLKKQLDGFIEQLPKWEIVRGELEKLPAARLVVKEADALDKNAGDKKDALLKAENAQKRYQQYLKTHDENKAAIEKENFGERILNLNVALDKVRAAAGDLQAEIAAKKAYDEAVDEYKETKKKCVEEDFDGLIEDLGKRLAELGEDENLLDYIKRNCKEVFVRETYEEVGRDLHALAEKHPTAGEDIAVLIEKYTLMSEAGETPDIEKMNELFKQAERQKKILQEQIEKVKTRKTAYQTNLGQLKIIEERGRLHSENLKAIRAKTEEVKTLGTALEIENTIKGLERKKNALEKAVEDALNGMGEQRSEERAQRALYENACKQEQVLEERVAAALADSQFATVDEARALAERTIDWEKEKTACAKFFEDYALTKSRYESADCTKFSGFSDEQVLEAKLKKQAAERARDEKMQALAAGNEQLKNLQEKREKFLEFEKELQEKTKEKDLCDELKQVLGRGKFLEFIASEYLQEICVRASKILHSLTSGRYFLRYEEKEFKVGDNLDGGNLRAVKTLSGGETFLVSLSLALALSGEICDRSRRSVDFFFLDEGFGTLDGKLVDTVMDVLAKLSKDFAVGLISHVEELKHRIDNKILVTGANEEHGSRLKVVTF